VVLAPAIGVVILTYVAFTQIYPVPPAPFDIFPYITAGWLLVAGVLVLAAPGLTKRIGASLARDAGPATTEPASHEERVPERS
jgi:hypothetical protein